VLKCIYVSGLTLGICQPKRVSDGIISHLSDPQTIHSKKKMVAGNHKSFPSLSKQNLTETLSRM